MSYRFEATGSRATITVKWPEDWIAKHQAKGFNITSSTGYHDRWVVVMTKSAGGESKVKQAISPRIGSPTEFVTGKWEE